MSATLTGCDTPLAEAYDVALLDLDGVCYRGAERIPHAAEAVAAARGAGMRMSFVTNNAARPPSTVAEQLRSLDIPAEEAEVVTSAQAAAGILAAELPPGSAVLAVGGPGLRAALEAAGLRAVTSAEDEPVAVAQGFARDVGWEQLSEATYAIRAGARYVATNLDATLPTERGFAVGNGSLVAAVRNATGVEPVSAGKPQAGIFDHATERSGARRPLVVGDRLDTDIAGARAAGLPSLHVLTGVNDARDVLLAAPEERPSYLSTDLRGLHEPHPVPEPVADGWWQCAGAAARVHDEGGDRRLQLREEDGVRDLDPTGTARLTEDAWRAAAAAAWAVADEGAPLDPSACPPIEILPAR
ncbi:HAD-IIA family hydrolase [Georgenia sp. 10Sc9-8]|uniref:HAD-IIA family hydrolase n=1 Tax=Georgenia halotolerans TaxID=3028317 RepID=A0ABT5U1B1_9MICO|nr:HAD-IIA family hydrolase [Georgenia halotolerans]